ncbi:MAG: hemolysin III family protein [Flavisolibacter sp.]|nr:hemolysin III family protein [Flavisolibacter sp.]
MPLRTFNLPVLQTADPDLKKEIVNSILHSVGILFGIISIPVLLFSAIKVDSTAKIIGTAIYGLSFLMVFTFSTLYHGSQHKKWKQRFKILDYISIYYLIAGTYTPFILIYQHNRFGLGLLAVLWTLTVIGTVFKLFFCGRWEIFSTIIYFLMGWSMLVGGFSFFAPMPATVVTMIVAGGILYSLGVIFFLWEKYFYSHAVWHSLVLLAAICHYTAVLLSV